MRLVLDVPDDTDPDLLARIAAIAERLSRQPEFAAEIPLGEDEAIQRMFTPERLAHIAKADAQIDAGRSFTPEQVGEHFAKKHAAWTLTHPR